jgi:trehalose 6-phosphate synthase
MRHVLLIVVSVILGVSVVALGFTFFQAQQERFTLSADMQYRTRILAESLKEAVEPAYSQNSTARLEKIAETFSGRERLLGVAVYNAQGERIAASSRLPESLADRALRNRAHEKNQSVGEFIVNGEDTLYVLAQPLVTDAGTLGSLVVVQDANYIDTSVASRWQANVAGVLVYLFFFSVAVAALVRWAIFKPLTHLAETIRSVRSGKAQAPEASRHDLFFRPLATEIAKLTTSLSQARTAASEEARLRLEKIDAPWTAERLTEFIKAYIKDRPIYVVSHAEPFVHSRTGRDVSYSTPAGGVVTAISSVMEACGGMWIAYGGGSADEETVDEHNAIHVPPDEPKYTLKRVWLTEKDIKGYYRGFANEALWPLCHIAHNRPQFRKEDWLAYRKVNGQFAEILLSELKGVERPLVLIQDYHFALLPRMIKAARPDAQVALFWHIPWPSAESFSICPWRKEILIGMLGADIVGFHTQQFCNNFIDTVGKEIESLIDLETFTVTREEHTSFIKPFPISIAFTNGREHVTTYADDRGALTKLGIKTAHVVLGVDRLDYTKGILERLRGFEYLLDAYPEYRGAVTLLQVSSPTREGVEKYREYADAVKAEADRINTKFQANGWKPVVFEYRHYSHQELRPLYKLANVCLVTSVHDGMNLVAKEFVAARDDEGGALVLSQFTGAARDLKSALIVNPYSAEEMAEAIHRGLSMSPAEQHRRMKTMRDSIRDYNIYRWAAELIKAVAALR